MSRIYWDTVLFIYWLEDHPQDSVEVIPYTLETADLYANLRATVGVSSSDAIHLACAAEARTDLFLTNDKNLVGKVIPGIQFIAGLDSNIL
jgi:predicted nucleic acid-binding protein